MRKDATVVVPLALGGMARALTPEQEPLSGRQLLRVALTELERLTAENASLRRDVAALRRDIRDVGESTSAISSVALCLCRMLLDRGVMDGVGEVRIPRLMHDRMLGASIRLSHDPDGAIRVRLREEGKERVVSDN